MEKKKKKKRRKRKRGEKWASDSNLKIANPIWEVRNRYSPIPVTKKAHWAKLELLN